MVKSDDNTSYFYMGEDMSYIVTIRQDVKERKIRRKAGKGVFISKILPIIIVDKITDKLINSGLVVSYREEETSELQAFSLIPPVHEKLLSINGLTGLGQVVAVIDSGFNSDALNNHIEEQIDFTGTKDVIDRIGHGTAVAKIVRKCAPGVRLINLKVTNTPSFGEANIIKALEWVYFHSNVNIVNMSLSTKRQSQCNGECDICQLVKRLYENGVLVVAAAGNAGPAEGTISCPANAEETIAVGAIDANNKVAKFSSRGFAGQNKPDLLSSGYNDLKNQQFRSGTSFSSPIVAGVAACVRTIIPDAHKLRETICKSTTKIKAEDNEQGNGVLCIRKLMEVLDDEKILNQSL